MKTKQKKDIKMVLSDTSLMRIGASKVAYKIYDRKVSRFMKSMNYEDADLKARLETMKILIDGVVDDDAKIIFMKGLAIYDEDEQRKNR